MGHALGQGRGRVVGMNVHPFAEQDRTLVQPFAHLHDLDAGLAVAGHDGALDRRGAAPARQQRGVDVDAAEPRRLENGLGQDQAIGDDDGDIGVIRVPQKPASMPMA